MDTYDYFKENFRGKLDALLEERYIDEDTIQAQRNKFVEDYTKRFKPVGSFKSALNNWIYRKSVPELRTLLNICEMLNAEPDYFLIATQTEFRKGAHSASELLGLPDSVISSIEQYEPEAKNMLIELVKSEYGDQLYQLLYMIFDCISDDYRFEVTAKEHTELNCTLSELETFAILKEVTADRFKRLLSYMHHSHSNMEVEKK